MGIFLKQTRQHIDKKGKQKKAQTKNAVFFKDITLKILTTSNKKH